MSRRPEKPDPALTAAANEAIGGDLGSLRAMMAEHYQEMRRVAGRIAAKEPHTAPSPTELVHEAFLRLIDQDRITARGRAFFFACFATECRRILVDHARARHAQRREGSACPAPLSTALGIRSEPAFDLLELNDAMEKLRQLNERMAQIVEMRLFGGLTIGQCAEVLGIARRTIDKDYSFARTWLRRELT